MIYLLLAVGVFAADYALKEHVNSNVLQGTKEEILNGKLLLRNCHNKGAAFGVLKNTDPKIIQEASALGAGAALWEFLRQLPKRGRRLKKTGLALIAGGGMNNYVERRRSGSVTDYVSVNTSNKKLRRLVFNLSDLCILTGAILWILSGLRPKERR